MCCEAEWKREEVPDHKFDFINIREFHRTDLLTRIKYIFVYIFLLKSIAVYGLDIFTAITMLSTNHWTNAIYSKCGNNCAVKISFDIAKWIFVGCIIFSFLLLGYESYKARKVVLSRDISYGFTNLIANDWLSLKNYDNFCLFCHINSSTKKKDDFAFFIFFTFKGWKRLLLADGPRQSINALTLYSFAYANGFQTSNIPAYWDDSPITAMLLFSMILTVLIFAGSLILLIAAAVGYVPLLCYIQGNLKEYVCHKVDKRISELIKKKQRQRIQRNAALEKKLATGAQITNRKGEVISNADVLQPTLPSVTLDYDDRSDFSKKGSSIKGNDGGIYPSPPPGVMFDSYPQYPPRKEYVQQQSYESIAPYSEEYGSTANLTSNAAPLGISYPPVPIAPPMSSMPAASYSSSAFPNPYSPTRPANPTSPVYSIQRGYNTGRQDYNEGPASRAYQANINSSHPQQGYSGRSEHQGNQGYQQPRQGQNQLSDPHSYDHPMNSRPRSGLAYDDDDDNYDGAGANQPSPAYSEVVRQTTSPDWDRGYGKNSGGAWGHR